MLKNWYITSEIQGIMGRAWVRHIYVVWMQVHCTTHNEKIWLSDYSYNTCRNWVEGLYIIGVPYTHCTLIQHIMCSERETAVVMPWLYIKVAIMLLPFLLQAVSHDSPSAQLSLVSGAFHCHCWHSIYIASHIGAHIQKALSPSLSCSSSHHWHYWQLR